MRSRSSLFRRAVRHPDVFVASVRHHSNRVFTRPIRTVAWILVTYAFVLLLVAFANSPEELQALAESGTSIAAFLALLPPLPFLLLIAVGTVVAVPAGSVTRGVRRDLRSSRRRRERRDG